MHIHIYKLVYVLNTVSISIYIYIANIYLSNINLMIMIDIMIDDHAVDQAQLKVYIYTRMRIYISMRAPSISVFRNYN